jgi:hypothetical protein
MILNLYSLLKNGDLSRKKLVSPYGITDIGIPVFQFEEQRSKLDIRGKFYESA